MTWPNDNLNTTDFDSGADSPSAARAMLVTLITTVKSIIGARGIANGICDLDASRKVPDDRIGRGSANGVASLGWNTTVPANQLPEATDSAKGVGQIANAAERIAGTAGRLIDASQLKDALDALGTGVPDAIAHRTASTSRSFGNSSSNRRLIGMNVMQYTISGIYMSDAKVVVPAGSWYLTGEIFRAISSHDNWSAIIAFGWGDPLTFHAPVSIGGGNEGEAYARLVHKVTFTEETDVGIYAYGSSSTRNKGSNNGCSARISITKL